VPFQSNKNTNLQVVKLANYMIQRIIHMNGWIILLPFPAASPDINDKCGHRSKKEGKKNENRIHTPGIFQICIAISAGLPNTCLATFFLP
jgi:hypothetical protein